MLRKVMLWAVFALLYAGMAVAQTSYSVVNLGNLGAGFSCAMGLNDKGFTEVMDVTATGLLENDIHFGQSKPLVLGTLGGPNAWNNYGGINNYAVAVGYAETRKPAAYGEDYCGFGTGLQCLPFVWRGATAALPTLGGMNGEAVSINNLGEITGYAESTTVDASCAIYGTTPYPTTRPVLWINRQAHELATGTDPDGFAMAINDRGVVAGVSGTCTGLAGTVNVDAAWLWQPATTTPTPLAAPSGATVFPIAMNNLGQVVGEADYPDGSFHAFLTEADGTSTDLGTLGPSDVGSWATGINDAGQVVGTDIDGDGNWHGFIWAKGVMTDMWTMFPANSGLYPMMSNIVNSSGQVSGMMWDASTSQVDAFLATLASGLGRGHARVPFRVTLPPNLRTLALRELQAMRTASARKLLP